MRTNWDLCWQCNSQKHQRTHCRQHFDQQNSRKYQAVFISMQCRRSSGHHWVQLLAPLRQIWLKQKILRSSTVNKTVSPPPNTPTVSYEPGLTKTQNTPTHSEDFTVSVAKAQLLYIFNRLLRNNSTSFVSVTLVLGMVMLQYRHPKFPQAPFSWWRSFGLCRWRTKRWRPVSKSP